MVRAWVGDEIRANGAGHILLALDVRVMQTPISSRRARIPLTAARKKIFSFKTYKFVPNDLLPRSSIQPIRLSAALLRHVATLHIVVNIQMPKRVIGEENLANLMIYIWKSVRIQASHQLVK